MINGTTGNDYITGTAGDDQINAGMGNDVIRGGGGVDTFYFTVGDGQDIVGLDAIVWFVSRNTFSCPKNTRI